MELLNIQQVSTLLNLKEVRPIAATRTSEIYKVVWNHQACVIKLLNKNGMIYEVDSVALFQSNQSGAYVSLLKHFKNVLVLQYLDGEKLSRVVHKGLDTYSNEVIARLVKLSLETQANKFVGPSLRDRFKSLFDQENTDIAHLQRAIPLADKLLSSQAQAVQLHGDLHHDNIMNDSKTSWKMIDPQPCYGDLAYTFANLFYNPDDLTSLVETRERIEAMAKFFANFFGINKEKLLQYAYIHGALSVAWSLEDNHDCSRRLRILDLVYKTNESLF